MMPMNKICRDSTLNVKKLSEDYLKEHFNQ